MTDPPRTSSDAARRLQQGKILVVGVGGLGAPAALHLATCGVGTIGLLDADAVELSNLQRQVLYRTTDLGERKVEAAARRLRRTHPRISFPTYDLTLAADNFAAVCRDFDFIIDGTDQVASKFLVNDGAVSLGIPFSHAGVLGFMGQTLTVLPRRSACLRCLFPTAPSEDDVPTCQSAGVIGPVVGTIGLLQATEAVKYLLGTGKLLAGRLLTYDAAVARWRIVPLTPSPSCPACGQPPA